MKTKYVISKESGYDVTNGHSSYKTVRTFRNEPEAMAFYNDPKNRRMYGSLFLERHDERGVSEWDDREEKWA